MYVFFMLDLNNSREVTMKEQHGNESIRQTESENTCSYLSF